MRKSQGLIFICQDRVMVLNRNLPYFVHDNFFKVCIRPCNQLEKEDIYEFLCGLKPHFEDQFDFPKGRGESYGDAVREFTEETGLDASSVKVVRSREDVGRVEYKGYDNRMYLTVLHLLISKDPPPRICKGEHRYYTPKWIPLEESISLFETLSTYDTRDKYKTYADILRDIFKNGG